MKSRLKEVIDYAENPDKTIDKRYVDSDLYAALQYVSNDRKTDERMHVSGINCNAKRAYERMTATKKRFGKTGGNVAYHGYQSFQTGEVTPEEAHKIGLETARRMWGKEYETPYPLRPAGSLKTISPITTGSVKSPTPYVWNTGKAS